MEILLPVIILGVIALVAGVGLSLASEFMSVPVDQKQEQVRAALPGANCGACGYSGCDGYAAAVAAGEAPPDRCAPGGSTTASALAELLGVTVENDPKIAFIACHGNGEITRTKYNYEGIQSCAAADLMHAGPLECRFGCVGFGDCAQACSFDAITLVDGRPVVCRDVCVGCGQCAKVCPKGLISLIPKSAKVAVGCANLERGAGVVKACGASCIACRMCEKACEAGAVKVVNNVAVIDHALCTGCGKCKAACKRGVLTDC